MSVLLLATWPAMEEREKEIFVVEIFLEEVEKMEVCGSWWKIGGSWNFGKLENHVVVEEGKKENRKRKRKWKREIILLEEKMKIMEVADSRV